jgi:hypothetical protein
MRFRIVIFLALTILLAPAAGCDPTPYGLTLHITDERSNPIPEAEVALWGLEGSQVTGEEGVVTWSDLAQERVTLAIAAVGYEPRTIEITMERGQNEYVVALEQKELPVNPQNQ